MGSLKRTKATSWRRVGGYHSGWISMSLEETETTFGSLVGGILWAPKCIVTFPTRLKIITFYSFRLY